MQFLHKLSIDVLGFIPHLPWKMLRGQAVPEKLIETACPYYYLCIAIF
jgi:hypothetical protein